jgi:hypothetical protein
LNLKAKVNDSSNCCAILVFIPRFLQFSTISKGAALHKYMNFPQTHSEIPRKTTRNSCSILAHR